MDLRKLNGSQLKDLIRKVEKRQRQVVKGLVAEVRAKVKALIKAAGLSVAEVFPAAAAKRGPGRPPKAAAAKGRGKAKKAAKRGYKVKPKYRNPDNPSQTWAGRGLRPKWYRQALASGRKEKDLLIG
jgi:DNA-binding protein H-NS